MSASSFAWIPAPTAGQPPGERACLRTGPRLRARRPGDLRLCPDGCQQCLRVHAQLLQANCAAEVRVEDGPEARGVAHVAGVLATQAKLREVHDPAVVSVEGHVPRGPEATETPDQVLLEVHNRYGLALCDRPLLQGVGEAQRAGRDLKHYAIHGDDIAVPLAVLPDQVPVAVRRVRGAGPHSHEVEASVGAAHHKVCLLRGPAALWQQGYELPPMDLEASLG
mmetsp:Transcript_79208/g.250211  ORF Transcript_79208/g.250211 Transcript_79208/m.250211 type:complete len:223 (-) Transcript_79208:1027-1695(-)